MASEGGQRGSGVDGVRPGQLSALLQEIAAAPTRSDGGWGAALLPGATIGKFELVREIGSGGFGVVWEARDRELGRRVAFKAVRAGGKAGLREERLLREAEAAARLTHPNIVTLHDLGRAEAGPYLVLELLSGQTLEERLHEGKLPVAEAVRIAAEVAKGVAHAHAQGVVHRDLKPANVFLCQDGQVKVLDFGLAHAFGQRRQDGGTPAYMAPEQWEGAPEDERTDVFALGVMLFRMLSGELPYPDAEGKDHRSKEPAPALEIAEQPELGALVGRMLAKRPVERPRDGAEVAAALKEFQHQLELAPASGPSAVRTRKRPGLRLAGLLALGVAVGALLAGGVAWWRPERAPRPVASADGRIVVAVADVVNETGEKELDVLSGLLVTSLEQSRRLSVMTQERILDLAAKAGRPGLTRVTETVGREVASAQGAKVLLMPAIRKLGPTYSLEMRALDPVGDRHLFTASDRATSKEALLDLLDRLSQQTRNELGEGKAEVDGSSVQLSQAMTRSVEAYQHYLAGLEAWHRDGLQATGLREFQAALRIDAKFAAAHGALAVLYEEYGQPAVAVRHWQAAGEHMDGMPEREKLLLRLDRAQSLSAPEGRSPAEIRRVASALEQRFPDDRHVLLRTAEALLDPDLTSETRAEAERIARRALALGPGDCGASGLLEWMLGDRPNELLENARRAAASRKSACNLVLLARAELAADAPEDAGATAREALRLDGVSNASIVRGACGVLDALARRPACKAEWSGLLKGGANDMERDFARFQLASALAVEGRRREARRLLLSVPEERRGDPVELARLLATGTPVTTAIPSGAGALAVSRVHDGDRADILAAVRKHPNLLLRRYVLHINGALDEADALTATLPRVEFAERLYEPLRLARQGRYGEAAEAQRRARDQALVDEGDVSAYWMAYLLGELLLAAGRPEEAAAVEVRHRRRGAFYPLGYASAGLRLVLVRARAMDQLGRRADAIRELDGLLAFWKEADPDLPLLVEAKAMRKRLAKAPVPAKGAAAPATPPSVAVLPFADMSPGKDQEYFADGVAEEILNALAQVPELRVIGRTSSFSLRGSNENPRAIGRRLGASVILEGSVRRAGDRLRIAAKLLRAEDGTTLWSEAMDGEAADIFAAQESVARAVVSALRVRLPAGGGPTTLAVRTTRLGAYDGLLRARQLYDEGTLESLRRAARILEEIVAEDPGYATAAAWLSVVLTYLSSMDPREERWQRARELADRAVALEPALAEARWARAHHGLLNGWDWAAAEADAARALRLRPSYARALALRAALLAVSGRLRQAIETQERAAALDPLAPHIWQNLAAFHNAAGEYDAAWKAAGHALEVAPGHLLALRERAFALLLQGRLADALAAFEEHPSRYMRLTGVALAQHALGRKQESEAALVELRDRTQGNGYQVAQVLAWTGRTDEAFVWLEAAREARDPGTRYVKYDPFLRPIHSDPRWKALLRKMNLPVE